MKVSALAYAAVAGLALAGCSSPQRASQAPQTFDTGNMAYPTPQPQGNIDTTAVGRQPADTGNMAYPTPRPQGNIETTRVGRQRRPRDTGSMAFPRPLPQGNIGTTQTQ